MAQLDRQVAEVIPDPRTHPTIPVEVAGKVMGVSRGSAYEAARAGVIPTIRIGRRLVVPTAKLLELLGLDVPTS